MNNHQNRLLLIISAAAMVLIMCFWQVSAHRTTLREDVKVPVILYHNVAQEVPEGGELLHITPGTLKEHLTALKNAGYHTISLEQYNDFLTKGTTLPNKPIIITFDDGYLSNYEIAYPLLKQLDMKATIFMITKSVGLEQPEVNYPHFTWEQAREMADSGYIEIGSHSYSHKMFNTLTKEEIRKELETSKAMIEENLGRPCVAFSYPNGKYTKFSQQAGEQAGYKIQCVLTEGHNDYLTETNEIRRITVDSTLTADELLEMVKYNKKN